ncbi:MAG: hypothetical protein EOO06_12375 [Chitinophagaceae bacterium]|nr:MAG: hypothetical protein EOO06_12375 [Chitinophagaceae bacterium]
MFAALEQRSLADIDIVRYFINRNEEAVNGSGKPRKEIRVYAVSACVTRLYAIYERFVETIISDYLDALAECVPFVALSDGFKAEYRMGISIVLSKLDHARYAHLNPENVIEWYHQAMSNVSPYRFVNEALIRHDQNLRLNIVEELLKRIQIGDVKSWISKHPQVKALYPGASSVHEQFESEVKDFVQLRNDAAHGTLDDLEGVDNLLRLCDVVHALVLSIGSFFRKSILGHFVSSSKVLPLGRVIDSFSNGAFVAKLGRAVTVDKVKGLYILSNSNCLVQKIDSMMFYGVGIAKITTKVEGVEVGLKCAELAKKGSKLFIVT